MVHQRNCEVGLVEADPFALSRLRILQQQQQQQIVASLFCSSNGSNMYCMFWLSVMASKTGC
jgi:hypothetical protein